MKPEFSFRGSGRVAAAVALAVCGSARAAAPSPDAVDKSIAKGVAFLYSVQQPNGTWETDPPPPPGPLKKIPDTKNPTTDNNQYGGKTAVAVYALLETGEKATEPKLKSAIEFLRTTPSVSTYVLSLKCQVWADLPPTNEVKQALRRDAAALLAAKKINADKYLVWDYAQLVPPRPSYNLNNVQNAAWGLSAAGEMDYEVPADVWKQIERVFTAAQQPDGGFGAYVPKKPPAPPESVYSTATGVSALYLAQDYSRADAYAIPRGNVANPQIEKGIAWITGKLDQIKDDSKASSENVHRRWYGVGTVALASGLRRLNSTDWYAEGATDLLKRQFTKDGHWGASSAEWGDYRVTDTAWALLFLQRGRVPVAFNKLDYSAAADDAKKAYWNQRPRDAANAARWISRATERELRWQVVNTADSVDALLEAPVLYMAGGETLSLNADAKLKLKKYVESGGLIFAAADAASANYAKSIEALGRELFPGNEWRDVPDTHPILATQMYKRASFKAKPGLRSIGNGVREFIVLAPVGDPAKTWQQRSGRINADAWQLAADVLSYAVDKSHFFSRGESWLVPATADVPRRTARLGRLKYAGQWDPEPLAFTQFENYAKSRDLGVQRTTVDAGQPVKNVDVLYVTGAAAFTLDDAARAAIKTYLDGGGRVIFEAAGGSAAFANAAQAELTRWYGADALKVLPPTHAVYGGEKLGVVYRNYNQSSIDRPNEPQLRGVEKDGRVVALLSREDLSAGLLGVPTDGITGYTPDSARAVLLRVLSNWK